MTESKAETSSTATPKVRAKTKAKTTTKSWSKEILAVGGAEVPAGTRQKIEIPAGRLPTGDWLSLPVVALNGARPGPTIWLDAALHGDEINGTGAIRRLIKDEEFQPLRGAVILIPVLNLLAFDRHSRYLPDRRDLNRSFPGSVSGSLASRMARRIFDEIVTRSDYGIDLHTAAVRRTNSPTVRGDMTDSKVRRLAEAFGSEIIINGKGPKGAFRREACRAGCPTIVMEGGEVWKVEPSIVESGERGVKNVLRSLEMLEGPPERPNYQVVVERSKWIRAERGGFLRFHIQPGDIIDKDQPIATNTTLLGSERSVLRAPFAAVVIGMTTLPAVSPGEPVCNLGKLPKGTKTSDLRRQRSQNDSLEERVSEDLASSVLVVEPTE